MNRKPFPTLPDHLPHLTDEEGEVREITAEDLKHFSTAKHAGSAMTEILERSRGQRGPQKEPVKERIGLRLNKDVVDHFRRTGPGWQSRINAVLAAHVKANDKN